MPLQIYNIRLLPLPPIFMPLLPYDLLSMKSIK